MHTNDITWTIETLPEDCPVRGNAMASGDNSFDKQVEDKILKDLEDGNEWAWCTVKVTGSFKCIKASEYIGCCSYPSKKAFLEGGYYEDMQQEVVRQLTAMIEELCTPTN